MPICSWRISGCSHFIAVLGGWGLTRRVARREYHRKWLDYRALAEAMRVEFFWKLAGLPQTAADHYLRNLQSEVEARRHPRMGNQFGSPLF